ncbi:hypothetical protein FA95DRAFT_1650377, partial [Auriscalpium vulgare]
MSPAFSEESRANVEATREFWTHDVERRLAELQEILDSEPPHIRRRRRNQLLPVSRLPPEILTEVFSYLARSASPAHPWALSPLTLNRSWIAVTYVCGHWRETALRSRGLWTDITSQYGVPWFMNMIARAKNMQLSVTIPSWPADRLDEDCIKALLIKHLPRTRELSLMSATHSPRQIPFYYRLIGQHAPSLRRLQFSTEKIFWYPTAPAFLTNITTLEIDQSGPVLVDPAVNLQWLVNDADWRLSDADVIPVLQNMGNLQHLVLREVFIDRRSSDVPAQEVILPLLER